MPKTSVEKPPQAPELTRHRAPTTRLAALACLFAACGAPTESAQRLVASPRAAPAPPAEARGIESFSPQPSPDPPIPANCAVFDAALRRVAERMAEALLRDAEPLDSEALQQTLREEGSPYIWPHTFTRESSDTLEQSRQRLDAWLSSFGEGGERRCGMELLQGPGGRRILTAIAVDVLADLEPFPRRVRVGAWMDLSARLLVRSASAKVFVLGPRGLPRSVPTSFDGQNLRARFSVDQPGRWLAQVVADVAGGPRQVLEAEVLAGDSQLELGAVPGARISGDADPAVLLDRMIRAARQSEGLPALLRDPDLDRLAVEQARALSAAQRVAHDLGSGDPEARVTAAGLQLTSVGENVAHASSIERAHRAIWRSPSHRANLLSPHFDSIGIGVATDANGKLWVCELFGRSAR